MRKKNRQPKISLNNNNIYIDREDEVLELFLKDIKSFPILDNDTLTKLILEAQKGNLEARNKVLQSNYRLLIRIAKEFQGKNCLSINDLIQEGFIGLDQAIDKYDISKETPFPHFASWRIKMKILKYILFNQYTVRLPETQITSVKKLHNISSKFLMTFGRTPSLYELKEYSDLSDWMIKNYFNLFNCGEISEAMSLDNLLISFNQPSDKDKLPDQKVDQKIAKEIIDECLRILTPEQQCFLREYYGIGMPKISISELASRQQCSTENIRQKRVRILNHLKKNCSKLLKELTNIDF